MPDTPPPMPAGHRRRRTARQAIRRLLHRHGDHRVCWCAACDPFEVHARRAARMPAAHPEWVTRVLPDGDEEYLAELAGELWPDDEHTEDAAEDQEFRRGDDEDGAACTT